MVLAVFLLTSTGFAADPSYPADIVKQVDEFKLLKRDKKDMPETLQGITNVTPDELKAWMDQKKPCVILDNRPADEYEKEHIVGAKRLNSDDLLESAKKAEEAGLKKDDTIVVYCNGVKCWRSPAVAVILKSLGYANIYWLRGGLPDWAKKGYDTAEGKE
jgi:rhodanese-related sulfurtransferase